MENKTMKIQVLDSGCSCSTLFDLTTQAVKEMELKTEVEYITDIQKIIEMGFMQLPVLLINGKPVIMGFVPNIKKIKQIIHENI